MSPDDFTRNGFGTHGVYDWRGPHCTVACVGGASHCPVSMMKFGVASRRAIISAVSVADRNGWMYSYLGSTGFMRHILLSAKIENATSDSDGRWIYRHRSNSPQDCQ